MRNNFGFQYGYTLDGTIIQKHVYTYNRVHINIYTYICNIHIYIYVSLALIQVFCHVKTNSRWDFGLRGHNYVR